MLKLFYVVFGVIILVSMSLFDVDKNTGDRTSPSPNHSDVVAEGAAKAHRTVSSHYTSDADASAGRLQMGNKTIIGNDGTTNRALLGYNSTTNTWGLFGSKAGQDVLTSDPTKYTFSTDYNSFKIVLSGSSAYSYSGGTTKTLTIAHNLGFAPIPLVYLSDAGGSVFAQLPTSTSTSVSASVVFNDYIYATTDATNLYITAQYTSGSSLSGRSIKYYLLAETAN